MPNIELLNDKVSYIPVVTRDAAGDVVPAAAGDVDSVTSSNPASLQMAIGTLPNAQGAYAAGVPALVLTPLVALSNSTNGGGSIAAQLTDTMGLPMAMAYLFDIVADLTPTNVGLDPTVIETTVQAVPTASGP
jgi:hypothetical protein